MLSEAPLPGCIFRNVEKSSTLSHSASVAYGPEALFSTVKPQFKTRDIFSAHPRKSTTRNRYPPRRLLRRRELLYNRPDVLVAQLSSVVFLPFRAQVQEVFLFK